MGQQIEVSELIQWVECKSYDYALDSKRQKRLTCTLRGSYEVWHKGVLVLECIQPFQAVEKYNSL